MGDTVKRRGYWWVEASNGSWMRWMDDQWELQDHPAPPPRLRERVWGASRALGLPAFILALAGLALTIRPSWISPTERAVIIKDTSITQGVEFREYVRYQAVQPFAGLKRADAESRDTGVIVDFNYELRGFPLNAILPLRWTLLDRRGERIRESEDVDRLFRNVGPYGFYSELRGSDVGSWGIWVQTDDLAPGRYFLRIELFDPSGKNRLAYKNSQMFRTG